MRFTILAALAVWLLAGEGLAQTFAEVRWFDRLREDCDHVEPGPAGPRDACRYRAVATLQVEMPLMAWLAVFGRSEVQSVVSDSERGHFDPSKVDLVAGVAGGFGSWRLTLFAGSKHCVGFPCDPDNYNGLSLRWTAPEGK